jgi:cytochrome c peroxidase
MAVALPVFSAAPAMAELGATLQTPATPMELPVEIEVETGPASLKQAPLWKELIQLLRNPYLAPTTPSGAGPSGVVRRPGFGATMPPLNVWSVCYNFLTAQPLRMRTSDGEVSWDQPGPLFDTEEAVPTDQFNVPTELRTAIGSLEVDDENNLYVSNPGNHPAIPPDGTIVAEPACQTDPATGQTRLVEEGEVVTALAAPVNEEDFLRPRTNAFALSLPARLRPYVGRRAAEVLGKALFWDMQVGSDGVQACGSCHFHAGADNRTKGQLNPNTTAAPPDLTLQVKGPNQDVVPGDFPFRKLSNPNLPGEGDPGQVVQRNFNDVMSSMGVSRFKQFVDIPPIGRASFLPASAGNGVLALRPDIGTLQADPVPANQGLRRVEPRNTPTFHAAAFNLDNFWDGRARFAFNGGSVQGASDPQRHIFVGNAFGALIPATNRTVRPDLYPASADPRDPGRQPVRIKFSSLASQAVGPPLSDFEMSFAGRNWAKIGKKMLQPSLLQIIGGYSNPVQNAVIQQVAPLANQLVHPNDSVLGPFSAQRSTVGGPVNRPGRPGLNISYPALIRLAFAPRLWQNIGILGQHLNGAPCASDPFDGYCLTVAGGPASPTNTNQFTQMEANFTLFFALAVQMYEQLTIPDDTPFDRFMDANPQAANGIGQPGEQAVLFPTLIPGLLGGGVTLVPGFGEEELFGMDIFMGGNLTAALPSGSPRNPLGFGSNPFARTSRCMLCHLGPEQTDHSSNISHGLLKGDAEFEFPTPPFVQDPNSTATCTDGTAGCLPAPEPPGPIAVVGGLILAEEIGEGPAQDAVEVEPRNFATLDDPATPWDDRLVAQPGFFAFGDQGVYNVALRPNFEDFGRGSDDAFGWPLSLAALTLKNIGGAAYEPCDGPTPTAANATPANNGCAMANFDPDNIEGVDDNDVPIPGQQGFEETGDGAVFPGTLHTLQSINPGFERDPLLPQLPAHMVPWVHSLPAGELHPQIDEMAGFLPNVITPPNGGPAVEFPEVMFGADLHCGVYDPAQFGEGPPNFGWGPRCPNNQSGVAGNFEYPTHGSWPVANRVLRNAAFKAPGLRNVELTGPYFHTGSYLTLRQVVDFYLRGGDFPVTNAENRDPHMMDITQQVFGFGPSNAGLGAIDCSGGACGPGRDFLVGNFADALPDAVYQYGAMPDTAHATTPEPGTTTAEEAKNALVRFLIALTDDRVRFERAPFDRPEIFVPIDGAAPENTGGRARLAAQSGVPCPTPGPNPGPVCFRRIPAVGADGNATPLPAFLGVTNFPPGHPQYNCVAANGPVSHFCAVTE